ncbi:MAG TPA: hypothetical protein VGD58_09555 [Herpetosiphonaceae bacterium]
MSRIIRRQGLIIIHIVLTLLTLSACSSSAPSGGETGASGSLSPIASADCEALRAALSQRLGAEVAQANAPFTDSIKGQSGTACQLTAKGTGKELGSFVDVADKIRTLLAEQGWTEDHGYIADGPTGTATGFRKDNALAVMSVGWQPAPEVQCPADQPISACEVAPEQQIFDISLSLAQ